MAWEIGDGNAARVPQHAADLVVNRPRRLSGRHGDDRDRLLAAHRLDFVAAVPSALAPATAVLASAGALAESAGAAMNRAQSEPLSPRLSALAIRAMSVVLWFVLIAVVFFAAGVLQ